MKMLEDNKPFYYYYDIYTFKGEGDFARYLHKRNFKVGMHVQDFFELNIITRGHGEHYIENSCVEANIGDVFIVPPNTRHGYTGGEGFDVYHIHISNSFMQKNLPELQLLPGFIPLFNVEPMLRQQSMTTMQLRIPPERFGEIMQLLDTVHSYNKLDSIYAKTYRTGFLFMTISVLCKIYTETLEKIDDTERNPDIAFFKTVTSIHEKYNEKLDISELAKSSRLSRSSFIRRFKHIYKLPPNEYIMKIRLDTAKNLLLTTTLTMSEIANRTGFFDSAHFTKRFVKENGISPFKYRNLNKQN